MHKSQFRWLTLAVVVGLSAAGAQKGWAGLPFPSMSGFENDQDTYVPSNSPYDLAAPVFGAPPLANDGAGTNDYIGAYGATSAGWFDGRNGANGVMEEVASGTSGITAYSGSNYGKLWPAIGAGGYGYGDGPFGRPGKQDFTANAAASYGGSASLGNLAPWSYQMAIYLKSTDEPEGPTWNGDYWWTNAIGDSTNGSYITETGFRPIHNTGTNSYTFQTTGGGTNGGIVASGVAEGQWVIMETRYDFTGTNLAAHNNLWAADGTTLLGTSTLTSLFQNPLSADALGGPRYSWFTYFYTNWTQTDYIAIDNIGVGTPLGGVVPPALGAKGDMDDSGGVNGTYADVDNFDIGPFELALTNPSGYLSAYPTMDETMRVYRGDINEDSVFDNFDIGPFESYLTNGPGAAVPEPSTFVLLALGGLGLAVVRRRRVAK